MIVPFPGEELLQNVVMPTCNRIAAFDIAKGIGICLVFLGHAGLPWGLNPMIYSFHMPLFFIISGYFLSEKDNFAVYAKKRARQLLIPYLWTALLGTICMLVYATVLNCGVTPGRIVVERFLGNLYGLAFPYTLPYTQFHIQMAGTIWFLPGLFFTLLLLRAVLKFEYPFLAVLMFASIIWLAAVCVGIIPPWSIKNVGGACIYAYIGFAAKKHDFIHSRTFLSRWFPLLCLALWLMFFCGSSGTSVYVPPVVTVAAVCMSAVVVRGSMLLSKIGIVSKMMSYIGSNTLFLLCAHTVIQVGLWEFSKEFQVNPMEWGHLRYRVLFFLFSPLLILVVKDMMMSCINRMSGRS